MQETGQALITPQKFGFRLMVARSAVRIRSHQEMAERLHEAGYRKLSGRAIANWEDGKLMRIPTDALPYLSAVTKQSQLYFLGIEPLNESVGGFDPSLGGHHQPGINALFTGVPMLAS